MTTQTLQKWNTSVLDNLIDLVIDYRGKTPKKLGGDWSESGIPAISAKNIKEGQLIREDQIRFVNDALYKKWMKEELKESDLLLTSEAPIGEVYIIKKSDPKYCLSQRLFGIRTKREKLDPKYLFYFFRSPEGKHELLKRATGTTVGGIRQTALLKAEIRHPSLLEQGRIAETLSTYDDLIENNTRRIRILEQTAQAIYSEIKQDGDEVALRDVITINRGRSYGSAELSETEGIPFVNLKCIDRDGGFRKSGLKMFTGAYKDTQKVVAGDIVIAVTDMTQDRRIVARAARIPTLDGGFGVISMDLVKIQPKEGNDPDYIYALLRWSGFADEVKNHANGANVLHLIPERITDYKTHIASTDQQIECGKKIKPMLDLIDKLELQNENLRQTRDLLIPKLVTGELSIK